MIAAVPTVSEKGPEGVGLSMEVASLDGLYIQLVVEVSDFDDEAAHIQLDRLIERLQLMRTAASNRRSGGGGS